MLISASVSPSTSSRRTRPTSFLSSKPKKIPFVSRNPSAETEKLARRQKRKEWTDISWQMEDVAIDFEAELEKRKRKLKIEWAEREGEIDEEKIVIFQEEERDRGEKKEVQKGGEREKKEGGEMQNQEKEDQTDSSRNTSSLPLSLSPLSSRNISDSASPPILYPLPLSSSNVSSNHSSNPTSPSHFPTLPSTPSPNSLPTSPSPLGLIGATPSPCSFPTSQFPSPPISPTGALPPSLPTSTSPSLLFSNSLSPTSTTYSSFLGTETDMTLSNSGVSENEMKKSLGKEKEKSEEEKKKGEVKKSGELPPLRTFYASPNSENKEELPSSPFSYLSSIPELKEMDKEGEGKIESGRDSEREREEAISRVSQWNLRFQHCIKRINAIRKSTG